MTEQRQKSSFLQFQRNKQSLVIDLLNSLCDTCFQCITNTAVGHQPPWRTGPYRRCKPSQMQIRTATGGEYATCSHRFMLYNLHLGSMFKPQLQFMNVGQK